MAADPAAARPKRASRRQRILFGVALGIGALCLGWAFRDVDFRRVWAVVAQLGPAVLLALVPYLLSTLLDGLGWSRIFRAMERLVTPLRLASLRLSTEALTFTVPGGMVLSEGVRLMFLQSRFQVPLTEGVSALAGRKCFIVRGHGLFLALASALGWSFLAQRSQAVLGVPGLPVLLGGAAVALLLLSAGMGRALGGGSTATRLGMLLERVPMRVLRAWLERRRTAFAQADTHLGRALKGRAGHQAAILYMLMWMAEASEGYLLLRLLGFEIGLTEALALEAVISIARSLAFFMPAGLGVQDAGYLALLRGGGDGQTLELAAAFVLLKRARELTWMGIGFLLLLHERALAQRART